MRSIESMTHFCRSIAACALAAVAIPALGQSEDGSGRAWTDLLEESIYAQAETALAGFGFTEPEERRRLVAGWHRYEADEEGRPFAWMGAHGSAADVAIAKPERLKVRVELAAPHEHPELPPQAVAAYWNGRRIGEARPGTTPETFEFDVAPGVQRHGMNRLELLPAYWYRPDELELSKDRRPNR